MRSLRPVSLASVVLLGALAAGVALGDDATFVLFVRFHDSALGDGKALGRGAAFASALSDGR